jgi:hypothetical protein
MQFVLAFRCPNPRRTSHRAFLRDATTRSSLRCPLYPQKRTDALAAIVDGVPVKKLELMGHRHEASSSQISASDRGYRRTTGLFMHRAR